jgi:hypothetical protein
MGLRRALVVLTASSYYDTRSMQEVCNLFALVTRGGMMVTPSGTSVPGNTSGACATPARLVLDAEDGHVGQADEQRAHARRVGLHTGSGGSTGPRRSEAGRWRQQARYRIPLSRDGARPPEQHEKRAGRAERGAERRLGQLLEQQKPRDERAAGRPPTSTARGSAASRIVS